MAKPKAKRRKSTRVYEPGSGAAKSEQLLLYQRALRELVREGYVDDPALRKRIMAGWHPGIEMAIMTVREDLPDLIKATAYKILLEYTAVPLAAERKSAQEFDPSITVVVAPWAAMKPAPALALPEPETIIEADAPTNNSTPATPTMSNRERLREQVRAQRETVVLEVPPQPGDQARVLGRMNQGQPYQLSLDERTRITERLRKGLEERKAND